MFLLVSWMNATDMAVLSGFQARKCLGSVGVNSSSWN